MFFWRAVIPLLLIVHQLHGTLAASVDVGDRFGLRSSSPCSEDDYVSFTNGTVTTSENAQVIPFGSCVSLLESDFNSSGELTISSMLIVEGHLRVDPDVSKALTLFVPMIIVSGRLHIGSKSIAFAASFTIVLLPPPAGTVRRDYLYRIPEGTPLIKFNGSQTIVAAENEIDVPVGIKGLVVVGGELVLNGWTSDNVDGKPWSRLAATAEAGSNTLFLRENVENAGWREGDTIVIATTDMVPDHTERHVIKKISTDILPLPKGRRGDVQLKSRSQVQLESSLDYTHWGEVLTYGTHEVNQMSAEVGVLTRTIRITTRRLDDGRFPHIGGHLTIFQTETPQYIDGVELSQMGQQGEIGRYPIHFHLCLSHPNSVVRRNAIHETRQRGIVIHGTMDLLVEYNVMHNITGHAFMQEDHYETGLKVMNNLILTLRPPKYMIGPHPKDYGVFEGMDSDCGTCTETDYRPSGLWITNANITVVGNAVAGSCECDDRCDPALHNCIWDAKDKGISTDICEHCSAVWFNMEGKVRGLSAEFPDAGSLKPNDGPLTLWKGNVLHSGERGVRYYRPGWRPNNQVVEEDQLLYKFRVQALFFHRNRKFLLKNFQILDCVHGVHFEFQSETELNGFLFVGRSPNNFGGTEAAGTGADFSHCGNTDMVGVYWKRNLNLLQSENHTKPNLLADATFASFPASCNNDEVVAAGIQFDFPQNDELWLPNNRITGVKVLEPPSEPDNWDRTIPDEADVTLLHVRGRRPKKKGLKDGTTPLFLVDSSVLPTNVARLNPRGAWIMSTDHFLYEGLFRKGECSGPVTEAEYPGWVGRYGEYKLRGAIGNGKSNRGTHTTAAVARCDLNNCFRPLKIEFSTINSPAAPSITIEWLKPINDARQWLPSSVARQVQSNPNHALRRGAGWFAWSTEELSCGEAKNSNMAYECKENLLGREVYALSFNGGLKTAHLMLLDSLTNDMQLDEDCPITLEIIGTRGRKHRAGRVGGFVAELQARKCVRFGLQKDRLGNVFAKRRQTRHITVLRNFNRGNICVSRSESECPNDISCG